MACAKCGCDHFTAELERLRLAREVVAAAKRFEEAWRIGEDLVAPRAELRALLDELDATRV